MKRVVIRNSCIIFVTLFLSCFVLLYFNLSVFKEDEKEEEDTIDISSYYKVYIDTPEGVEVYLDGNYIGISPVSFAKKPGTHTITLRKNGYVTRSYTIEIDKEEKDVTYSFADLLESDTSNVKEEKSQENNEETEENNS